MRRGRDQDRKVHIPVRIVEGGGFEYFYGGSLPTIKGGTIGDLVVPESSLPDAAEVARLQQEHVVPFLPSDSVVRFAIDGNHAPSELGQHLKDGAVLRAAGKPHAIEICLKEPLLLRLRGSKPATLESANCSIPSLNLEAKSLNHAYRLISEEFEPERLSHAGNVFELAYSNPKGVWVSLDDLRSASEARYEMLLSRAAAEVFGRLPAKVGAVLRHCWGGYPETSDELCQHLEQYRSKLAELQESAELVDINTAYRLIDECRKMAQSISDKTPEEHVRLIQAGVRYLILEKDEESDTESPIGFDDDALVVRAVAEAIKPKKGDGT